MYLLVRFSLAVSLPFSQTAVSAKSNMPQGRSDMICDLVFCVCQVDFSIHDSLAVFTAVMIARHCFTLENLVSNVALQSLLAACPSGHSNNTIYLILLAISMLLCSLCSPPGHQVIQTILSV